MHADAPYERLDRDTNPLYRAKKVTTAWATSASRPSKKWSAPGISASVVGSGQRVSSSCSVVAAPYEVDGQLVGTIGVIGPTRMAYERVIPIVDITAKLLSSALTAP